MMTERVPLICPYCHRAVWSCEGKRQSMRAHRINPANNERCPASGLTVEEAEQVRPVEHILEAIADGQ
jgi:hypothetical protein